MALGLVADTAERCEGCIVAVARRKSSSDDVRVPGETGLETWVAGQAATPREW